MSKLGQDFPMKLHFLPVHGRGPADRGFPLLQGGGALFPHSHLLALQAVMGTGPALSCFLAPDSSPEKGEHPHQQPHLSLCHPGLIYKEKKLTAASLAK